MRSYSFKIFVGAAMVALIFGAAGPSWAQRPQFGPPKIRVAKVVRGEMKSHISLIGTVYPHVSTTISSEVGGVIKSYPLNEGDYVAAGQPICSIDDTKKKIEESMAVAQLKRAEAELAKLLAGSRKEEIDERRADVLSRKATAEKLKLSLERSEKLYAEKIISLEDLQNARLSYEAALADKSRAMASLELAEKGPREEDIMASRAEVETRKANLASVREDLKKYTVRSPISGFITVKHAEIGELISYGGKIASIIDTRKVYIRTDVLEKDVANVFEGQPAEIVPDAFPGRKFEGKIKEIIPKADLSTRSFPIRIEVDNPKNMLKDGMFARIELLMGKRTTTIAPKDALLRRGEATVAFVVVDGGDKGRVAKMVEVELGQEQGDKVEIVRGLEPEQLVVVTGNETLRDGLRVEITN